jgi:toxin CcdB
MFTAMEARISNPRFNPTFTIERIPVVLHPLEIVSVTTENLGKCVQSLKPEADRIIGALDELITRAWE